MYVEEGRSEERRQRLWLMIEEEKVQPRNRSHPILILTPENNLCGHTQLPTREAKLMRRERCV